MGKSGEGNREVDSGGRCEGVKGPEREGGLRVNREEAKGEEEAGRTQRMRHRSVLKKKGLVGGQVQKTGSLEDAEERTE